MIVAVRVQFSRSWVFRKSARTLASDVLDAIKPVGGSSMAATALAVETAANASTQIRARITL